MSEALAIAASGLKSEQWLIDKIANDLANLNTANYKASKVTFADVLYQPIREVNPSFQFSRSLQVGLGTAIYKTEKDFTPGPLKPSNQWNDVAIDGQGFFQVYTAEGNIVYTRNSTLSVDAEGYLATQDGLRLADNIQVPDDFLELLIQKNGEVEAILANETEPQPLGCIKLARFLASEALSPLGNGLYSSSSQTGEALIDTPGMSGLGFIMQKQIENSNVDMVNALMQLTLAQRVYQLNSKALQVADEMEKMTNELRG